jgi:hypothetical protein
LTFKLLVDLDTDNRFGEGDPRVDSRFRRLRTDEDEEAGEGGSGIECQVGKRHEGNGNERSVWRVVESGGESEEAGRAWKRFKRGLSSLMG